MMLFGILRGPFKIWAIPGLKKLKKSKNIFLLFFVLYAIKYQKKCIKKNSALFNPFSGGFFMGGVRIKKIIKLFLCSKYCRIFLKFM